MICIIHSHAFVWSLTNSPPSPFSLFFARHAFIGTLLTHALFKQNTFNFFQLNGINTQGENIADNGGIKEAYQAYKDWVRKHGEEPRLPGLNYTGEQLFWVSAATVWCSKTREQELRQLIVTDEHSPDKYRVLGAFSNMEDFAKDYKCKPGSNMNPVRKCKIW